eukprot:TRINITY_DN1534_c1_g1_i1.p1 TRINITY_DN1534_c1_g1~~TRINITY_DN1534_c1_g1_i1.p1  ORF type:complete len:268 (-),score=50.68 TRINITY_DN1534_c1_g1_i1:1176-1979(-)
MSGRKRSVSDTGNIKHDLDALMGMEGMDEIDEEYSPESSPEDISNQFQAAAGFLNKVQASRRRASIGSPLVPQIFRITQRMKSSNERRNSLRRVQSFADRRSSISFGRRSSLSILPTCGAALQSPSRPSPLHNNVTISSSTPFSDSDSSVSPKSSHSSKRTSISPVNMDNTNGIRTPRINNQISTATSPFPLSCLPTKELNPVSPNSDRRFFASSSPSNNLPSPNFGVKKSVLLDEPWDTVPEPCITPRRLGRIGASTRNTIAPLSS